MRTDATAEQDFAPGMTPSVPWRILALEVLPGHRLRAQFLDGTEGTVDMSRLVFGEHAGVFEALRDPQVFDRASLKSGAVTWPGDIDVAPDSMYLEIKKSGAWIV